MANDSAFDQKNFYEKYWKRRKDLNRIHTEEKMWIPPRIKKTVDFIIAEAENSHAEIINILDLACGEGTLGKMLGKTQNKNFHITGCDISETALELSAPFYSELNQINFENDNLHDKLKGKTYDVVVALEVLEHLFHPEKVLSESFKLLNENGILITSFPNIAWYKYRIEMLKGNFPNDYLIHSSEHIQHFTYDTFIELLDKNQFQAIEIDPFYVLPKWLKPKKIFKAFLKPFPKLFGYQIVVKAKKKHS